MSASKKDPTDPIRLKASRYPGIDKGTACTQSSFKTGKKAFLYIGMQGGRYKAMFKLQKSMPEAAKLATKESDPRKTFQVRNLAELPGPVLTRNERVDQLGFLVVLVLDVFRRLVDGDNIVNKLPQKNLKPVFILHRVSPSGEQAVDGVK